MSDEVIDFIKGFIDLNKEEIQIIQDLKIIRSFQKNTILLSEGDFSKECYFIIKGCIRSYYLVNGDEKTTEFYTENQSIIPIAYQRSEKSQYYLSCLEDCILAIGSEERNKLLLEKLPKLSSLILQMNSEQLVKSQIAFDNFKKMKPEERYIHLLESRPDLFERVSLQYISTYLGITPVSLSRMRKRILIKG